MPDNLSNLCKERWLRSLLVEKIIMDKDRASLADSELCRMAGVRFVSDRFCIIMIDITDIAPPAPYDYGIRETDAVAGTVTAFTDALSDDFLPYPFFHANDIFMLINIKNNDADSDLLVRSLAGQLNAARLTLQRRRGISVQVLMSHIAQGFDALSEAFTVLSQIMDVQQLHPAQEPIYTPIDLSDELTGLEDYKNARKLRLEHIIIETAMAHDFDATYAAFCELIDIESRYYGLSMSMNTRICSRIEVLFGLLGVPYFSQGQLASALDAVGWISASLTPEELKSSIRKTLGDFAAYFEPEAPAYKDISEEIAAYIEEHYSDYSLCVDILSDRFGISLSYLSRMFKEKRGVRLLDFIHMTRVRHARQLLADTDRTVEQVGNAAGYQNKLTFNRAFKRLEGKTPGAYRAEIRNKSH